MQGYEVERRIGNRRFWSASCRCFVSFPSAAASQSSADCTSADYGKAHGVGIADAIVAATATTEDAELKTLNVKHYPMLRNLEPAYRK